MRNVTRVAVVILSVLFMGSVFISCKNASKNENAIIGKWSYVSHGNTNTIEFLDNGRFNGVINQPVFSSDNNSSYDMDHPFPAPSGYSPHNITGTYAIKGDKITMTNDDSEIMQVSTFVVNGTTLTLTTGGTESSGIKTVQETIIYKRTQ